MFGKGWFEGKEPLITDKGLENKAPRHREAAIGDQYKDALTAPIAKKNDTDIISLRFDAKIRNLIEEFAKEKVVERFAGGQINLDGNTIRLPKKCCKDFVKFIEAHGHDFDRAIKLVRE